MRESSPVASNWRADQTLREYLIAHNIVAIADIDTRALTRKLRSGGVHARRHRDRRRSGSRRNWSPGPRASRRWRAGTWCKDVTCAAPFEWQRRRTRATPDFRRAAGATRRAAPARSRPTTSASSSTSCAGWRRTTATSRVFPGVGSGRRPAGHRARRHLPEQRPRRSGGAAVRGRQRPGSSWTADVPMFGICLGHQVLGLALGGTTYKLKFGHRGGESSGEEPGDRARSRSRRRTTASPWIPDSLPSHVRVTHLNLYDGTVEGLRHVDKPVFSRAVPSRGVARTARCGLPVPAVSG